MIHATGGLEQLVLRCPPARDPLNRALAALGNADFREALNAVDQAENTVRIHCHGTDIGAIEILGREAVILGALREEFFPPKQESARSSL